MRVAPVFQPFARYWRLNDQQARAFWTALVGAESPQPRQWRQQLLLFQGTHLGSTAHLIDQVSTPAVVIAVLEDLITEGRLPSQEARAMEACILEKTDRDGQWRETRVPVDIRKDQHHGDRTHTHRLYDLQ